MMIGEIRRAWHWRRIRKALDRAPAEAIDAVVGAPVDQWCRSMYVDVDESKCLVSWMLTGMGADIDEGTDLSDLNEWEELEHYLGMDPAKVADSFDVLTCTCYKHRGVLVHDLVAQIKSYIATKRNPQIKGGVKEEAPATVGRGR